MVAAFLEDFWGLCDTEINVSYPPNNNVIFERWLLKNHHNYECKGERCYLPIQWTAYYVNNNYGNDKAAIDKLQDYLNRLNPEIKYWTCIQYDDGILNDIGHLDLLQFNMSKQNGVMLPLLCQPHPYKFSAGKKWFASFIGGKTHPVRAKMGYLRNLNGYNISFEPHFIQDYCRILNESMFSLCPRGYGLNSFRIAESVQYGAIPVYVSDEFILPSWMNFEDFGVLIKEEDIPLINEKLQSIPIEEVVRKQNNLSEAYENFYSYEANLKHIINYLENE